MLNSDKEALGRHQRALKGDGKALTSNGRRYKVTERC